MGGLIALLTLAATLIAGWATGTSSPDAFAVVAEFDRMADRPLWPGFEPRKIPLAVFDGKRTLLVRHSHPPPGFARVEGKSGMFVYAGRHPEVAANTSVLLGGETTATGLLSAVGADPARKLAAVMIHEAFHVFEKERHPAWTADEGQLFTYPVEDAANLAGARLEIESLRRALLSPAADRARCLARAAWDLRRERMARLDRAAVAYERGVELKEGLAAYLEARAAGTPDAEIGLRAFPAEEVRARGYASGPLIGRLLDRISPAWKERLEHGGAESLEALLAEATSPIDPRGCGVSTTERATAEATARRDVSQLEAQRQEVREKFLAAPGWTLVVEASGEPLWPKGFDPLNLRRVSPAEALHTRWLKLGNAAGEIEVFGRSSMTLAAGTHPLFQGIRRLIVSGLPETPAAFEEEGVVSVRAAGVTCRLKASRVEAAGTTLTVRIGPAV